MVARSLKSFSFIVLIVVSSFFISEARPLNVAKSYNSANKGIEIFFDGLDIEGIKSGPSSGGRGHKYTSSQTLGGIKYSGPSPGKGNHYTTSTPQSLGGTKHSGPSPGIGNYYTTITPQALGGIKHSGPAPGRGNWVVASYMHL